MRESLSNYCNLFIKNRDILKENFKWEHDHLIAVSANSFAGKGITVNAEKLKECRNTLRNNVNVFSNIRGNAEFAIVTHIGNSSNAMTMVDEIKKTYEELKEEYYTSSYLPVTATILAEMMTGRDKSQIIKRSKGIYELMKKEHPFLTSGEDVTFAMLLAFSEKTDEELLAQMEECYNTVRALLKLDMNAAQSLSHVLSLSDGDLGSKIQKLTDIYRGLENRGRKYSRYYEISVLGALSLMPADADTIVEDILAVDEFLSTQKGYGFWGIDKRSRLMHAAMIVIDDFDENDNPQVADAAAVSATLAFIAAQQAAMTAVVASTMAASSAQ